MHDILKELGPIIACVMVFGIPIVAILVKHQQKMAMIMRQDLARHEQIPAVDILRGEVDQLKAVVHQQTILLDTINSQQSMILAALKKDASIEQRLQA